MKGERRIYRGQRVGVLTGRLLRGSVVFCVGYLRSFFGVYQGIEVVKSAREILGKPACDEPSLLRPGGWGKSDAAVPSIPLSTPVELATAHRLSRETKFEGTMVSCPHCDAIFVLSSCRIRTDFTPRVCQESRLFAQSVPFHATQLSKPRIMEW
ncbi:hypothetical protein EDC04DRAFT_1413397 [Pisolithus marmoratus]|nr:hypothetical protein EDC04DRAFT_1413397 [Pisolithus marmoratus]